MVQIDRETEGLPEPSTRALRAAMLSAAGMSPDNGVWSDEKVNEVMKQLGGTKLRQLMKDQGRIEDRLIASELEELERRLGKLEDRVSQLK